MGWKKYNCKAATTKKRGRISTRSRFLSRAHVVHFGFVACGTTNDFVRVIMPKGVSETIRLCDTHFGAVIACLRYHLDRQRGRR